MRKITDAQIAAWKKQHVNISKMVISQDGKKYSLIVRKPKLDDMLAADEYAKEDNVQRGLFLYKQCVLGGDAEFEQDDELKFAASLQIAKLFRILSGTVTKL